VHLDLIDSLRCPADHEEATLVATIDRLEGRYIATGALGCPACGARYEIRDFAADFRDGNLRDATAEPSPSARPPEEEVLVRAAAMLDTRTPGGLYVLTGTWGWYASALAVSYDVQCVVISPSAGIRPGEGLSVLLVGRQVPLAAQCARGTAIDAKGARDVRIVAGCIAAVRVGGRIVAPSAPPPAVQARELASDAQWWVGERIEGGGSPIPITRARP